MKKKVSKTHRRQIISQNIKQKETLLNQKGNSNNNKSSTDCPLKIREYVWTKKTPHLAQSSNYKIKTNKTNYATYSGRISLKPERLASEFMAETKQQLK